MTVKDWITESLAGIPAHLAGALADMRRGGLRERLSAVREHLVSTWTGMRAGELPERLSCAAQLIFYLALGPSIVAVVPYVAIGILLSLTIINIGQGIFYLFVALIMSLWLGIGILGAFLTQRYPLMGALVMGSYLVSWCVENRHRLSFTASLLADPIQLCTALGVLLCIAALIARARSSASSCGQKQHDSVGEGKAGSGP